MFVVCPSSMPLDTGLASALQSALSRVAWVAEFSMSCIADPRQSRNAESWGQREGQGGAADSAGGACRGAPEAWRPDHGGHSRSASQVADSPTVLTAGITGVPRRSLFLDPWRALRPAFASAGSTGISLAMVAAAEGCRCHIAMPDDAALEKSQLLAALGADVQRVRPVSISHPGHFVNVARKVTPHLPEGIRCIYHEEERG